MGMKRKIQKRVTEVLRESELTRKDLSPECLSRLYEKASQGLFPYVVTMPPWLDPANAFRFPFDTEAGIVFDANLEWHGDDFYERYPNIPPRYGVRVWAEDNVDASWKGRDIVKVYLQERGIDITKPGGPYLTQDGKLP